MPHPHQALHERQLNKGFSAPLTKEIENYLLIPGVLKRAIQRSDSGRSAKEPGEIDINGILEELTEPMQSEIQAQILAKRGDYLRNSGRDSATLNAETLRTFSERWRNLESRLKLVPGKEVLAKLRTYLQAKSGTSS